MPKVRKQNDKILNRVVDANYNRAKEGLRVCEDVCRFVLDAKGPTRRYKLIRHQLTEVISGLKILEAIRARNIEQDVGKKSTPGEFKRKQAVDIFYANSQRVKESIRVLEEFSKLRSNKIAEGLKRLRYRIYHLEQNVIERF